MEQLSFAEIYKRRASGLDYIQRRNIPKNIMTSKQEENMLRQNLRGMDPISAQKELLRMEILKKQLGFELPEHKRKELLVYGGRSIRNPNIRPLNPIVAAINTMSNKIVAPSIANTQLPPQFNRYQFVYDVARKQVQSGILDNYVLVVDMVENVHALINLLDPNLENEINMNADVIRGIIKDIVYKNRFIFLYYHDNAEFNEYASALARISKHVLLNELFKNVEHDKTIEELRNVREQIVRSSLANQMEIQKLRDAVTEYNKSLLAAKSIDLDKAEEIDEDKKEEISKAVKQTTGNEGLANMAKEGNKAIDVVSKANDPNLIKTTTEVIKDKNRQLVNLTQGSKIEEKTMRLGKVEIDLRLFDQVNTASNLEQIRDTSGVAGFGNLNTPAKTSIMYKLKQIYGFTKKDYDSKRFIDLNNYAEENLIDAILPYIYVTTKGRNRDIKIDDEGLNIVKNEILQLKNDFALKDRNRILESISYTNAIYRVVSKLSGTVPTAASYIKEKLGVEVPRTREVKQVKGGKIYIKSMKKDIKEPIKESVDIKEQFSEKLQK
jgi:hypothetical protein